MTIAIPEMLELLALPKEDRFRKFLIEAYQTQVTSLKELQADSGLWHTILDDPNSYQEVFGSVGFIAGILAGLSACII